MIRLITLFIICLIYGSSFADDHNYSFAAIPPQLLENSNSLIRFQDVTLEIHSAGKAVMKVSYALTILKETATKQALLIVGYNKFSSINHLKGYVYDKNGDKVEHIEQDKFYDFSAISGFSTYEDNRLIACQPKYRTVPFTVEYSYEIDYNGILDFPDFYLVTDFNVSVEQASLNVLVPDSIGIKYFERNITSTCERQTQKSVSTYSWRFKNIPSLRDEPYSPSIREISPAVLLAPRSFKLKRIQGATDTWNSIGLWYYELIKDRDDLSNETRQKIKALVEGTSDTLDKIRKLYCYLQDKTRYTSVQIGIGGWQPAFASEVDRLGYGDCKALTNYMKSLLTTAGIDSYYTLVSAGKNEPNVIPEFASHQFNHVILCVPLKNDTIWLECTSQDLPMGYLSTFTDDRYALVIRNTGGFLCHTPVYDQKVNIRSSVAQVQLQDDGKAIMKIQTNTHGLFYDDARIIKYQDEADKRKSLIERISAHNFVLENFSLKENKTDFPGIEETLNLNIQNITIPAGGLLLLMPNQLSTEDELSSQVIKRNNPVRVRRTTLKTDTVFYHLPDGISFTGNHINQVISSRFGEYRSSSELNGQTIRYVRSLVVFKGEYLKDSYEDFLGFFEQVAMADAKKITLKSLDN